MNLSNRLIAAGLFSSIAFGALPLGIANAVVFGCLAFPALAADDATTIATNFAAKYEQMVASKDAAQLAGLFTDDAVFQNPKGTFKGRPEIEHYREDGFKAGVEKEKISVDGAQRVGDIIYDYGDTTIFINSASGPKQIKLRWGSVLKKSNDGWKIALLTATPMPPPKSQ